MKKKIFGGLIVLAIAAVAAFNVNLNSEDSEDSEFSLLSLANVEALAGDESGNGNKTKLWCCGNTGVCGIGADENGNEIFKIAGKVQGKPCKE